MVDPIDKASTSATQETYGQITQPPSQPEPSAPLKQSEQWGPFHVELPDDMDLDPLIRGEGQGGTYRTITFNDIPPS